MQAAEFKNARTIKPLKFSIRDVPHATIETNRTCNMRCRSCYNLDKQYIKDIGEIKKEIDLVIEKRNLEAITLLGGEPTLHEYIAEIISYVKSRKLVCQLLTNGLVFLSDRGGSFVNSLVNAGIDRILLHIDIGQDCIYEDITETRAKLFSMLEKKKVHFSLAMTIYSDNKCTIPELVTLYSKYSFFDGVLAVIVKDGKEPDKYRNCIADEYKSISNRLTLEPATYVPSNLSDEYVSWLIYYYFVDTRTGNLLPLSPLAYKAYRVLYRLIKGHHMLYSMKINPCFCRLITVITCLFEMIIFPKKIAAVLRVLGHSLMIKSPIRFHSIVLQNPPEIDKSTNLVQFCYHCPDATIRNGMLTPVCLADYISPLTDNSTGSTFPSAICKSIYKHLGEE